MGKSIEQICRDLLEVAIEDNLVRSETTWFWKDPHPQARSAGELWRVANVLKEWLLENKSSPWFPD